MARDCSSGQMPPSPEDLSAGAPVPEGEGATPFDDEPLPDPDIATLIDHAFHSIFDRLICIGDHLADIDGDLVDIAHHQADIDEGLMDIVHHQALIRQHIAAVKSHLEKEVMP